MMKRVTLQSLINRATLTSSLIPLFTVGVVLLLMYFGVSSYITGINQETLLREVQLNLQEITSREVQNIDDQLNEVSRLSMMVQRDHQMFFEKLNPCALPVNNPKFGVHQNGVYYKTEDNGGSSLYYSSDTILGRKEKRKARLSEAMDPLLKSIVDTNPIVAQAYFNSWDNMNRIYPFMKDAPGQYGPVLDMESFNFYYEADLKHNPRRGPVWTGAYLDPAGQGWMVSNIVPIYRGDFLEGVSGLDVTIDSIVTDVLRIRFPWQSNSFIVDEYGSILAMQQSAGKNLGLKQSGSDFFVGNQSGTSMNPEEYSIFNSDNTSFNEHMQKIILHRKRISEVDINGVAYLVSQELISETGWRLFTLIPEEELFAPINELKTTTHRIGYVVLGIMTVFYLLFFLVLLGRSRKLAAKIATPVEQLSVMTNQLGGNTPRLEPVGIKEIDELSHNFTVMVDELDERTQELVESQLSQRLKTQEAELFEKMAETDALTGLFNRRKIDAVLEKEIARSRRYDSPFGVILLDVDHFKSVNDTYGHQVGDLVLVDMSSRVKEFVRKTDVVGRWGGEEILIVCPEASEPGLMSMAEKLRTYIDEHEFPVVVKKTASFGVAIFRDGDEVHDIIARADEALYKAKSSGRNCVRFK